MATENLKLGKNCRVYIGNTANPADDTEYALIENENELSISYSVDAQEIDTKSAGKISLPGTESYELTFTTNAALNDTTTYALLQAAKNKSWPYQVREGENKMFSGNFVLTGIETSAGAVGVREGSYTLKNSGTVTEYDPETGTAIGA
jgi:hypothetical protein